MVTWTFDLGALLIGFLLGDFVGALVTLYFTVRLDDEENGIHEWNKGYKAGCEVMKEIYTKGKEKDDV